MTTRWGIGRAVLVLLALGAVGCTDTRLKVYNAIAHTYSGSDPNEYAVPGTEVIGRFTPWSFWAHQSLYGTFPLPEGPLARECRWAEAVGLRMVLLGIEQWSTAADPNGTAAKLRSITKTARTAAPTVKFGWYRLFPIATANVVYCTPEWEATCRILAEVWDFADFIAPRLYAFKGQGGLVGWEAMADRQLEMARLAGKPVHPVLWPYIHHNSGEVPPGTPVPLDWWCGMLAWCEQNRVAPIIWCGPAEAKRDVENKAPWVTAVVEFVHLKGKAASDG